MKRNEGEGEGLIDDSPIVHWDTMEVVGSEYIRLRRVNTYWLKNDDSGGVRMMIVPVGTTGEIRESGLRQ